MEKKGKELQSIIMIDKVYFTEERKKWATDDLRTIMLCAKAAGIDHAIFVAFGLLLGIVRERDFVPHDNDIDMCIRSDLITPDQEIKYYKELKRAGMTFARFHYSLKSAPAGFPMSAIVPGASNKQKRFTWFSIRKKKGRAKFCNWFMIPWNGYYWHSKSGLWVTQKKFDQNKWGYAKTDDAIMKGVPARYLDKLIDIDFRGVKINVPLRYGSCLDYWYPGWLIPRFGGASAKRACCIVKRWLDKKTWRVAIK